MIYVYILYSFIKLLNSTERILNNAQLMYFYSSDLYDEIYNLNNFTHKNESKTGSKMIEPHDTIHIWTWRDSRS